VGFIKKPLPFWRGFLQIPCANKRTTMQKISYFENEKGDYTITLDDVPVSFTKDEDFIQKLLSLQRLSDSVPDDEQIPLTHLRDYILNHADHQPGMSIYDMALQMIRERDLIANLLKLRK
jgi:hypothetical protein